jgi:hypothetical protein
MKASTNPLNLHGIFGLTVVEGGFYVLVCEKQIRVVGRHGMKNLCAEFGVANAIGFRVRAPVYHKLGSFTLE